MPHQHTLTNLWSIHWNKSALNKVIVAFWLCLQFHVRSSRSLFFTQSAADVCICATTPALPLFCSLSLSLYHTLAFQASSGSFVIRPVVAAVARSCENWNKVGCVIHSAAQCTTCLLFLLLLMISVELQIVVWPWHKIRKHTLQHYCVHECCNNGEIRDDARVARMLQLWRATFAAA